MGLWSPLGKEGPRPAAGRSLERPVTGPGGWLGLSLSASAVPRALPQAVAGSPAS